MIYPRIGLEIAGVLKAHGIKNKELAEVHSGRMGLKPASFCAYLINLKKGCLYGIARTDMHRQEYACRLAHILYSAGIKNGHQLIKQIRQIDSGFQYPPRAGISYKALKSEFFRNSRTLQQLLIENPERAPSIMELLLLDEKSYETIQSVIHRVLHLQKQSRSLERKVESIPNISVMRENPESAA